VSGLIGAVSISSHQLPPRDGIKRIDDLVPPQCIERGIAVPGIVMNRRASLPARLTSPFV
jgi:hypothetical protein